MGIFVLLSLLLGFYWLSQSQWFPRRVGGTPGTPAIPAGVDAAGHATPAVPAVLGTPGHLVWEWNLISISSVPGVILIALALWIFWIMFFTPAILTDNQTRFVRSSSQWSFRPLVGDKVGNFVLDQDGKDLVKEVAKQVHENRNPVTTNFTFVPESARFVIRPVYRPMSFVKLDMFEVECAIIGKATWDEEEVDSKGGKKTVNKTDNTFTVRGAESFNGWTLDSLLNDYDFVKTGSGAGGITATGHRSVVNKLFSGSMKTK